MYKYSFLLKETSLSKTDLKHLLLNKEFVSELNAIIAKNQRIEDVEIYNIAKKIYFSRLKEKDCSDEVRYLDRAVRHFSNILYQDEYSWKKECEEKGISAELFNTVLPKRKWVYKLPPQKLYKIFRYENISEAFRKFNVIDDVMAYDVCKILLFQMMFNGFDRNDQKCVGRYYTLQKIVQNYAKALGIDNEEWKNDYNNFLETKTFVVRKASRNGGYEKMYFTEKEISFLKQKDKQLDDADEDL